MAVSVSILARHKTSTKVIVEAKVTFDSSYASGGELLTAADFGLSAIEGVKSGSAVKTDGSNVIPVAPLEASGVWKLVGGFLPALDGNAASAQALGPASGDVSAYTCVVEVTGR